MYLKIHLDLNLLLRLWCHKNDLEHISLCCLESVLCVCSQCCALYVQSQCCVCVCIQCYAVCVQSVLCVQSQCYVCVESVLCVQSPCQVCVESVLCVCRVRVMCVQSQCQVCVESVLCVCRVSAVCVQRGCTICCADRLWQLNRFMIEQQQMLLKSNRFFRYS